MFFPFTDMRTGKVINSIYDEITESYQLSHQSPSQMIKIETEYGAWIHGKCPSCGSPLDNWHARHFCGNCGTKIEWNKI